MRAWPLKSFARVLLVRSVCWIKKNLSGRWKQVLARTAPLWPSEMHFDACISRITDQSAREYHKSRKATVLKFHEIISGLQQNSITRLVEVGPGPVSVVALANALLKRPMFYCAFEENVPFSAQLSALCNGLRLRSDVRNAIFSSWTNGTSSECLIFEHSLEDWFLKNYEMRSEIDVTFRKPSGSAPDFLIEFQDFLFRVISRLAASSYGCIIFHHYIYQNCDDEMRNDLDMVACSTTVFDRFEDAGWRCMDLLEPADGAPVNRWIICRRSCDGA